MTKNLGKWHQDTQYLSTTSVEPVDIDDDDDDDGDENVTMTTTAAEAATVERLPAN